MNWLKMMYVKHLDWNGIVLRFAHSLFVSHVCIVPIIREQYPECMCVCVYLPTRSVDIIDTLG